MADKFQLKAILTAVDKITPTLKNIRKSTSLLHKSLRDIGNAGGELMRKIGIPAFLSFSAVSYAAIRAGRFVLEYASNIQDAASRTGSSTTEFQALSNLLGLVGGTAEDAEMSMTKFNKGIADAAGGKNKEFASLMKKLRIPIKDAKGEIVSLSSVLPQLAEGFARNPNPAMQTRMALQLFSKGGAKMIPVLKGLADGSLSLSDALKAVVATEAINDLDNMGDSLTVLETKVKNTLTNALAKMVPVLMPIVESMSAWISANQEFIQTSITKSLTDIANALKEVDWKSVIKDFKATITTIRQIVNALGGLKGVLVGLGLAFIAGPIAAIMNIALTIGRLLMITNPVVLTLYAIAAAGYLIFKNWDQVSAVLMPALSTLSATFSDLWAQIKQLYDIVAPVLIPILKILGTLLMAGVVGALFAVSQTLRLVIYLVTVAVQKITFLFDAFKKIFALVAPDWLKNMFGSGGSISVPKIPSGPSQTFSPLEPNNRNRPNFLAGTQNKLNGEVTVKFENTPPGARVDVSQKNKSGLNIGADVGYSRLLMG